MAAFVTSRLVLKSLLALKLLGRFLRLTALLARIARRFRRIAGSGICDNSPGDRGHTAKVIYPENFFPCPLKHSLYYVAATSMVAASQKLNPVPA
jgi:hypothetical protein